MQSNIICSSPVVLDHCHPPWCRTRWQSKVLDSQSNFWQSKVDCASTLQSNFWEMGRRSREKLVLGRGAPLGLALFGKLFASNLRFSLYWSGRRFALPLGLRYPACGRLCSAGGAFSHSLRSFVRPLPVPTEFELGAREGMWGRPSSCRKPPFLQNSAEIAILYRNAPFSIVFYTIEVHVLAKGI